MSGLFQYLRDLRERSARAPSCAGCPFYAYSVWRKADYAWVNRDHRSNFCVHPSFIESYGVEQHTSPSDIDQAPAHWSGCPLVDAGDVESLLRGLSDHDANGCEGRQELNPFSILHPRSKTEPKVLNVPIDELRALCSCGVRGVAS